MSLGTTLRLPLGNSVAVMEVRRLGRKERPERGHSKKGRGEDGKVLRQW